ncbi:hypothetical protein LTR08_002538 [Meristemomyces frigidus]|nr:hypothetical protein LTR08_002538 [Meristemomyces frigidus]
MPPPVADEDITVDDAPTEINPYFVLSLEPDATQAQIKSAYRKAALRHHPDKASPQDKKSAHEKFQEVAFAYAILSDEARRTRYDNTGSTAESLEEDADFNWATFYKDQYRNAVTTEKIDTFAKGFKLSEEEREHVLAAYEKFDGNMDKLYDSVMLSDVLEDDERFRAMIDAAIKSGKVEALETYTKESEKSRKARIKRAMLERDKEAKEAEAAAQGMVKSAGGKKGGAKTARGKDAGMGDLAAMIQQRQKDRSAGDFFEGLEAKYAEPAPKKGKKGAKRGSPVEADEPSEDAFANNRKAGKGADATEGARRTKRAKRA